MIVTLTFSPSIDKSVSIKKMQPNAKMKCFNVESYAGGGGINVARVLTRFGCDVHAVFPASECSQVFFKEKLAAEKVAFSAIPVATETRESIEFFDEHAKKQYRLVMPGNELSEEEWKACLGKIKQFKKVEFIVVSGSLPAHAPATIFTELAMIAVSKNAKLVIDTSGKSLKKAIEVPLFLIKPNLEEFAALIGHKNLRVNNLKKHALQFLEENKCENLVVSLGSKGAMLFNKKEIHYMNPLKVKVKSTVGAGDSMLAGIIYGLEKGLGLEECLNFGVAFGTATTLTTGTSLCSREDVERLLLKTT